MDQWWREMPAIARLGLLGIPSYHYGYEALHGVISGCPFPDLFPFSSAASGTFNRPLWHLTGSAQIDRRYSTANN